PFLHIDTFLINRQGNDFSTGRQKRSAQARIAGILDPHLLAWIDQEARNEIERLLGSRGHEHLLRLYRERAHRPQVGGNSFAEWSKAARFTGTQELTWRNTPEAPYQTPPHRKGKEGGLWHAGDEGPPRILPPGWRTRRVKLVKPLTSLAQARRMAVILCGARFLDRSHRE